MNTAQLLPLGALLLVTNGAEASMDPTADVLVTVTISGESLFQILDKLGTEYGYTIGFAPAITNRVGPDTLYVAPTPASRAFEVVAAAYGACAIVDNSNNFVRVLPCDTAGHLRSLVDFGVLAKDARAEGSGTVSVSGALVVAFLGEQTAAFEAGIREGDVITGLNTEAVSGATQLNQLIRGAMRGRGMRVAVLRGSEHLEFDVRF